MKQDEKDVLGNELLCCKPYFIYYLLTKLIKYKWKLKKKFFFILNLVFLMSNSFLATNARNISNPVSITATFCKQISIIYSIPKLLRQMISSQFKLSKVRKKFEMCKNLFFHKETTLYINLNLRQRLNLNKLYLIYTIS